MTARKPAGKAKRPVGRPRHVPTPETREAVRQLVSVGQTREDVATYLRISRPTLDKNYDVELRFGWALCRAEVIGLLFKSARSGNVAAQKHLDGLTSVAGAEDAIKGADEPAVTRAARLGKKEVAAQDAATAGAGTEWAGDLGPATGQTPETAH